MKPATLKNSSNVSFQIDSGDSERNRSMSGNHIFNFSHNHMLDEESSAAFGECTTPPKRKRKRQDSSDSLVNDENKPPQFEPFMY
jgi:hypothetical protein